MVIRDGNHRRGQLGSEKLSRQRVPRERDVLVVIPPGGYWFYDFGRGAGLVNTARVGQTIEWYEEPAQ